MPHVVKMPITQATYQQLVEINAQLDQNHTSSVAKSLAANFTQLTREVLHQAFGAMVERQIAENADNTQARDTQKILQQIDQQIEKYMPWSISLLGNDRLKPVARYILNHMEEGVDGGQTGYAVFYPIDDALNARVQQHFVALKNGDEQVKPKVFADLVDVIDSGVTTLIREPKNLLKFNFVVSKTLDGVTAMITSLGYKRIEKIGQYLSLEQAQDYADHFHAFLKSQ